MPQMNRYICPCCGLPYVLGLTGTVDGCDECLSVIRNTDNTIIETYGPNDERDEMTDMEKA